MVHSIRPGTPEQHRPRPGARVFWRALHEPLDRRLADDFLDKAASFVSPIEAFRAVQARVKRIEILNLATIPVQLRPLLHGRLQSTWLERPIQSGRQRGHVPSPEFEEGIFSKRQNLADTWNDLVITAHGREASCLFKK